MCLRKEGESYQTVKKISLLHIKELSAEIDALATKPFPALSISEKCITTETMIYIIETGYRLYLWSTEGLKSNLIEINHENSLQVNLVQYLDSV